MKRTLLKKSIALCLSLSLLLGLLPVVALAATGVEVEPNDERATQATSILVNTDYVGDLTDRNDDDYYKFTLTQAQMVQISLTVSEGTPYHSVKLVDATNSSVLSYGVDEDSDPNPYVSSRYNLPAGDYYILVEASGTSTDRLNTGNYTLCVIQETETSPYTRETEYNGSKDDATLVQLDTTYVGNSQVWSEDDYYKLVLTEQEVVQVNFQCTEGTIYHSLQFTSDAYGSLFNETLNSSTSANPYQSNRYTLPAGTYYLKVDASGNSSDQFNDADYTLSFDTEADTTAGIREQEYNNSETAANPIQVNTTYVGHTFVS